MNRIAKRAHELYEARSGQYGTAIGDWLTAERQIDDEIDRAREKVEKHWTEAGTSTAHGD